MRLLPGQVDHPHVTPSRKAAVAGSAPDGPEEGSTSSCLATCRPDVVQEACQD